MEDPSSVRLMLEPENVVRTHNVPHALLPLPDSPNSGRVSGGEVGEKCGIFDMVRLMGHRRSDYLYTLIELAAHATHTMNTMTHDTPRMHATLQHAAHAVDDILTTAMHMRICDEVINDVMRQGERDGYDSDMNLCLTLTRQEKGPGPESEEGKEGLVEGRGREGPDDEEEVDRKGKGTGESRRQTDGRKDRQAGRTLTDLDTDPNNTEEPHIQESG